MILSIGEVSVSIPGFHPILLVRAWCYGRSMKHKIDAGELTVEELAEQLRESGVKVKVVKP